MEGFPTPPIEQEPENTSLSEDMRVPGSAESPIEMISTETKREDLSEKLKEIKERAVHLAESTGDIRGAIDMAADQIFEMAKQESGSTVTSIMR